MKRPSFDPLWPLISTLEAPPAPIIGMATG